MADALHALETELAVYGRRIEHLARRSTIYATMDRAGYLLARTIADGGPAGVGALAQQLRLDGSTVTRQIAALEAKGHVSRSVDPGDGRASIIALTSGGRREMRRVERARLARIGGLVADWPTDDVGAFAGLLARFNRSLADSPEQ